MHEDTLGSSPVNAFRVASNRDGSSFVSAITPKITIRRLWQECVVLSDETTATKLFLLVIGRFFDKDGHASSMSLTQVQREASISRSEAVRCGKRAADKWLRVEVKGGHQHKKGRCNLYHAMLPPSLVEKARANILGKMMGPASAPQGLPGSIQLVPGSDSYHGRTDNQGEGYLYGNCKKGETPAARPVSDATNVVDFAALKWGVRS
jgi:hypothetical protein